MSIKNKNLHLLSIFFLSLKYILPFLIFGKITTFYIDTLDSEVVYNYILGKIYKGEISAIDYFLAGEIKLTFLRRLFQPFSLFYLLDKEIAYWTIDILVKTTSYISFFILAKKINKNLFFCAICACLYASMNFITIEGFLLAIFPYLIYLILFKEKLKIKHYIVIILFGINSDFLKAPFLIFYCLFFLIIFNKAKKNQIINLFKINFLFLLSIFLSNINVFYGIIYDGPTHREAWQKEYFDLINFIKSFVVLLLKLPSGLNYDFALFLPFLIFLPFLYLFSVISKNKIICLIFFSLVFLKLSFFFFSTQEFINLITLLNFPKTFTYTYYDRFFIFFYCILLTLIFNEKIKFKIFLIIISIVTIIIFQINASIIPLAKQNIKKYKEEYYRNYYTFYGFYASDKYKNIKKIVKNDRVISIGFDPMAAIANDIKTIDGYHNLYPLSYKIAFNEVIRDELANNKFWHNYYNNWGSRVYAIVNDAKNIKINFLVAQKLGAVYVLSKYKIKSKNLKPICENCNTDGFYLYKII
jgi:hypothetical protein